MAFRVEKMNLCDWNDDTVDGSEIRRENHLRLVVYPIIYRVFYIPGGAGFLPSRVSE